MVNFTHLIAFRDEIELYVNIFTNIISVKYYIKTFFLKDVKNPTITCLEYLHVRQS